MVKDKHLCQECGAAWALYGIYTWERQTPLLPVSKISTQAQELLWCKHHAACEAKRRNARGKEKSCVPAAAPDSNDTLDAARYRLLKSRALGQWEWVGGALAQWSVTLWYTAHSFEEAVDQAMPKEP